MCLTAVRAVYRPGSAQVPARAVDTTSAAPRLAATNGDGEAGAHGPHPARELSRLRHPVPSERAPAAPSPARPPPRPVDVERRGPVAGPGRPAAVGRGRAAGPRRR